MGDLFSIQHLLLILLIVVLIFGTKKLRSIGTDLGGAVKGFKEGMAGSAEAAPDAPKNLENQSAPPPASTVVEQPTRDKTST